MSGEIFTDSSMLEIFRAEVETHVESLTSGLLTLERDPGDTSHIDEMMRGAHSIKGAARIVGIDPAVRVAHVMEDGFVAAQNGKLNLRPEHVDALLSGVDMLNRIANATQDPGMDWTQFDGEATRLVADITAVLAEPPHSSQKAGSLQTRPEFTPNESPEPLPERSLDVVTVPLPVLFDAAAAEIARLVFVSKLDANVSLIRFDLSKTNDLDAIGLAFLAAVPGQINHGRTRVELIGAAMDLRNLLEATGIDRLYPSGVR